MAITAQHLANKHLSKLGNFKVCCYEDLPDNHKENIIDLIGNGEDSVLGVYKDESKPNSPEVIFTEKSIVYFDTKKYSQWHYRDIISINGDMGTDKMEASELHLFLSDSKKAVLKITGGGERFRDVYTVHSFLLKVANLNSCK